MTIRFGIIGCGAIAEDMHIPTLLSCSGVELVAAVDTDLEHARRTAERHGIRAIGTSLEAVAQDLDAVLVCTPPAARPQLVESAFARGLHVLAEKPLANSLAECERMAGASKRQGLTLAVSHMFRFYPVRARLHEIVAAHDLGRIRSAEIHEGAPYAWSPRSGYTFKRAEVSGGVVVNAGIHSLDSLIGWFGDPIIESYQDDAIGGLESNARASLAFEDDVRASFRISRTCRLPSMFRIACERGTVEFSNRDTVQYRIEVDGGSAEHQLQGEGQTPAECWRAQLQDFVDSIGHCRRPRIDGAEASRVVALVERMYGMKQARELPDRAPLPGLTW